MEHDFFFTPYRGTTLTPPAASLTLVPYRPALLRGVVAVAEIEGMGTWTDTETGVESRLPFLADMRFAVGRYIGVDGKGHRGSFGFL